MKFSIEKNPYGDAVLFTKKQIEFNPNTISCLVGCNGTGKTTLIDDITYQLKTLHATKIRQDFYETAFRGAFLKDEEQNEEKIFYINFDKRSDTTYKEMDYFLNAGNLAFESTGEGIISRFGRHLQVIGNTIRQLPENSTFFIFLDDCDAGTSIDMIQDIKDIFSFITRDCIARNITYYIILTANSFEMCKDLDCISVHDFKHRQFKTYDSFKKFVLKSREIKNKRERTDENANN